MRVQVDKPQVIGFFKKVIKEQVSKKESDWIHQQEDKFGDNFQLRSFYFAFSSASRFIRKKELHLTSEQLQEAQELRKGFQPEHWNLLQFVRAYLLLMLPEEGGETFEANLRRLYETADVDEQVTLYKVLPLLPHADLLAKRATEGIRTNITDVFDAIALDNPYPSDFLDRDAWNQMLLKAVFMQRPLYRIYGADERANSELAEMLTDFAHERWAANRMVQPELWRFVGPFLNDFNFSDIGRLIKGEPLEKKAALLACARSEYSEAQQVLNQYPDFKKDIESGKINWTQLGKQRNEDS